MIAHQNIDTEFFNEQISTAKDEIRELSLAIKEIAYCLNIDTDNLTLQEVVTAVKNRITDSFIIRTFEENMK